MNFLNSLQKNHKLNKNTVYQYYSTFNAWMKFEEVTEEVVVFHWSLEKIKKSFLVFSAHKKDNQVEKCTLNGYVFVYHHFLKYLAIEKNRKIKKNIFICRNMFVENKIPKFLNLFEQNQLAMILMNDTQLKLDERVLVALILNHGLSVSEIQKIKMSHFNHHTGELYVFRKETMRTIYLTPMDQELLIQFAKNNHDLFLQNYLFEYFYGNLVCRLSRYRIRKTFEKVSKLLNKKVTPQKLRNSFIHSMLVHGMPDIFLMDYLGLTCLKSFMRYQKINTKRIEKEHRKYFQRRVKPKQGEENDCRRKIIQTIYEFEKTRTNKTNKENVSSPLQLISN